MRNPKEPSILPVRQRTQGMILASKPKDWFAQIVQLSPVAMLGSVGAVGLVGSAPVIEPLEPPGIVGTGKGGKGRGFGRGIGAIGGMPPGLAGGSPPGPEGALLLSGPDRGGSLMIGGKFPVAISTRP